MKAIGQWIVSNPSAVKAYLMAVLALIAKGILALTGKTADLGQWSGFVEQAIDLLVGGFSIYGVITGAIHATRGPTLTSTDQAAAIVAALAPAPVAEALTQVKAITAEVTALPKEPVPQSFPESHKF